MGSAAGISNSKGFNNAFIGYEAAINNTYSSNNTAIGTTALYTQSYQPLSGVYSSYNVAVGNDALYTNQPSATTNGIKILLLDTVAVAIIQQATYSLIWDMLLEDLITLQAPIILL